MLYCPWISVKNLLFRSIYGYNFVLFFENSVHLKVVKLFSEPVAVFLKLSQVTSIFFTGLLKKFFSSIITLLFFVVTLGRWYSVCYFLFSNRIPKNLFTPWKLESIRKPKYWSWSRAVSSGSYKFQWNSILHL